MLLNIKIKEKIINYINREKIALFIKGTPQEPQCGFSAKIIEILDFFVSDYVSINVLEDEQVRNGIKEYSNWPTIPQLYVDQKFIGGSDVVSQMYDNGELLELFNIKKISKNFIFNIKITNDAKNKFINFLQNNNKISYFRLTINAKFEHKLSISILKQNDVISKNNDISLILDPVSATRVNNIIIDYKQIGFKEGFKIINPNKPPKIKQINALELKRKIDNKDKLMVFDVRTKEEWDIVHIKNTYFFRDFSSEQKNKLNKHKMIVFLCHHGMRSQRIAESFRMNGFTNVYNLIGGIDEWSRNIDTTLVRY